MRSAGMDSPAVPRVSLLTPPGVGAIAVIRLQGPRADPLLKGLFHPRHRCAEEMDPDRIQYGELRDGRQMIDDVLVVPTVEGGVTPSFDICAHGGLRVVERIVLALTHAGAVFVGGADVAGSSWPASSTIEQETWEALTRARTRRAVRFLLRQRSALPAELRRIARTAVADAASAVAALQGLLASSPGCRLLVEDATVAISGPPNAGKSTLANRLVGLQCSVVSPRPGTTLDWVAQEAALAGVPITVIDTPGYGAGTPDHQGGCSGGHLARVAVARARERSAAADLHLWVFDGSQSPAARKEHVAAAGVPTLLVLNKSDLGMIWTQVQIEAQCCEACISVSAARGTNVDRLAREITAMLGLDWADEEVIGLFTERQIRVATELAGVDRKSDLPRAILRELIGEGS